MVEVHIVQPGQLSVPWAVARSEAGRTVLFLRSDAPTVEVVAGYEEAESRTNAA